MQFRASNSAEPLLDDEDRVLRSASLHILKALGERAYEPVESATIEIGGVEMRYRIRPDAPDELSKVTKRRAQIELFLPVDGSWTRVHAYLYFDYFE